MKKLLLPFFALTLMLYLAWLMVEMRPVPEAKEVKRKIPFVEIVDAKMEPLLSTIVTFGTVNPRTSTTLIAEVPGIIQKVAPFENQLSNLVSFRAGGFFQKGDLLMKIEDTDLLTFEAEALANLRRTELLLLQEQELAKQAKVEWGDRNWDLASDLVKRIPQIQKATADTLAAEAKLLQASQDVNRSQVRAPFQGRILKTMVDVGQQVGSGASTSLAEIYALDSAEINFSLSRSELNFLGFTDGFKLENKLSVKAEVLNSKGIIIHRGILERSQGVVDPRTRLTNLIAQVNNCFANPFSPKNINNPLTIGQFVKLRLKGEKVNVFLVPESAFRTQNKILTVDKENRLSTREVKVIHRAERNAWVTEGLQDGDRICITPIEIISEGMKVNITSLAEDSNKTAQ